MALNKWIGMGRLTAAPELKTTPGGKSVTSFTIAVDRSYKPKDGERQSDFIMCVAWGQTAEHITRWFGKGSMICVEGEIQTRSYTAQDGSKRFVTEVNVTSAHFTGERKEAATNAPSAAPETYEPTPAGNYEELSSDDELPF